MELRWWWGASEQEPPNLLTDRWRLRGIWRRHRVWSESSCRDRASAFPFLEQGQYERWWEWTASTISGSILIFPADRMTSHFSAFTKSWFCKSCWSAALDKLNMLGLKMGANQNVIDKDKPGSSLMWGSDRTGADLTQEARQKFPRTPWICGLCCLSQAMPRTKDSRGDWITWLGFWLAGRWVPRPVDTEAGEQIQDPGPWLSDEVGTCSRIRQHRDFDHMGSRTKPYRCQGSRDGGVKSGSGSVVISHILLSSVF